MPVKYSLYIQGKCYFHFGTKNHLKKEEKENEKKMHGCVFDGINFGFYRV